MLKGIKILWRDRMPLYCNKKVWGDQNLGLIVKPEEWWRRSLLGKFPYFTYQHIRLKITILIFDNYDMRDWEYWRIWEYLPSREWNWYRKWKPNPKESKKEIRIDFSSTYVLSQEGDVEVRLKHLNDLNTAETLFSCKAISPDAFLVSLILIAFSLLGGILLGKYG